MMLTLAVRKACTIKASPIVDTNALLKLSCRHPSSACHQSLQQECGNRRGRHTNAGALGNGRSVNDSASLSTPTSIGPSPVPTSAVTSARNATAWARM